MTRSLRACRHRVGAALILLGGASMHPLSAADAGVATRLAALAEEHGFRIQGIDRVVDAPAGHVSGDLATQLRTLLLGYNHVVEGTPPSIRRIIILGPKTPAAAAFSVPTKRRGSQHAVAATLHGSRGLRLDTDLVVDTGASSIVLAASLMATLGFDGETLPDREAQTVNGSVNGKSARIDRVIVGGASARDVSVLFVDDALLGGVNLLGMSFLERFTLTIHDGDDRLVLTPR